MKFLTQKGFTLVEVLIGASLMGGVALITAKLMGDQASNQAYLKTLASISSTVSMIENNIQNPVTCRGIFAGKPLNVSALTLGTSALDANVLTFVNSAGVTISIFGEKDYGDFTIENNAITLKQSPIAPSIADLSITFTPKSKSSFFAARSTVTKKISFVVSKNSSGSIIACGSILGDANISAKKTFCTSLRGAADWDVLTNKCRLLSVKCPYGQVGTRMTSIGSIICVDLASQVNLSELFDTTPVNCLNKPNLQIVNSGNKFKINCTAGACSPVNGGWSAWTDSTSCVSGTKLQTRTCSNPTPSCNGSVCGGGSNQTVTCGLADGTICSSDPASSLPDCVNCMNQPLLECGCGSNPSTKATCGRTSNCSAWSMCY